MRKVSFLLLSFFTFSFICLFQTTVLSQEKDNPITITGEIDRAFITIGDPIKYEVTIRTKKNVEVLSYVTAPNPSTFEIKKSDEISGKEGSYKISGMSYEITLYELGEYVINPVSIDYRIDGGEVQSISSKALYITVESIAENEEKKDIRDVKGVIKLPHKILKFAIPIGLILFLIALILGYIHFVVKRKSNEEDKIIDSRSLQQKTIEDLHELFDSPLIKKGQYKAYYLRLSEILKNFLERRYDVQAIELTTFEIMKQLKATNCSTEFKEKLQHTLEHADFAKFAKWKPTPAMITQINKQSEEIVQESGDKPKLEEEDGDGI